MIQKKIFGHHPIATERCWIKYQLNLRGILYEVIANKAHCTETTVSRVVRGRLRSKNVEAALAEVLGYESFDQLIAAAVNAVKEGSA